jgi:hypothetical protein
MPQTYADLTIAEVLSDPLINSLMNADHVTRGELELLMASAARKNIGVGSSRNRPRPVSAFALGRSPARDGGAAW